MAASEIVASASESVRWMVADTDVLDLLISFCTHLVWIVYAQLLHAGFRRQRRPSLILNRGHGRGPDAL